MIKYTRIDPPNLSHPLYLPNGILKYKNLEIKVEWSSAGLFSFNHIGSDCHACTTVLWLEDSKGHLELIDNGGDWGTKIDAVDIVVPPAVINYLKWCVAYYSGVNEKNYDGV